MVDMTPIVVEHVNEKHETRRYHLAKLIIEDIETVGGSRKVLLVGIEPRDYRKVMLSYHQTVQNKDLVDQLSTQEKEITLERCLKLDPVLDQIKQSICDRANIENYGNTLEEISSFFESSNVSQDENSALNGVMESMQNITIRDGQAEDAMTLRTISVSKPKSSQLEDESASAEKVSVTYSKSTVKRSRDMPKKAQAFKSFIEGQVLLKYGKFGYPKQKHVYFDGERLRWRANTNEGH